MNTTKELQYALAEEISDDATSLFAYLQLGALDASFDIRLARLRGRVDLLSNIRRVLAENGNESP